MSKKYFNRILAVTLSAIMLIGSLMSFAIAEDDFLLQLFVLALLDEYGLYSTEELLDLLDADSVEHLYDTYGSLNGYGDSGYLGGDDDVAYYDDEGYPIYLDERSGCYYGLYDDDTAYIAGSVDVGGRKQVPLNIPSSVGGYPVYDVFDYAFADVTGISSVTIAEGVERISEGAFAGCDLKSLTLPRSLRNIEYSAFAECEDLAEVSFASGLEYIGVNAFAGCRSLRTVILPDSVTEIDYDAFFNCASLEHAYIGSELTKMAGNVFSMSDKLNNLTVSDQNRVFVLRDGVLYNTVSNSIVRYPGNRDEQEFIVPDGVICVEDGCFADANSLLHITLPDSVKTIEDYAFYGCRQCQYFDLGEGVTSIGDGAIPTNQLRGIRLPDSVEALQELSLFSMADEPYAYDDFWVIADVGSYAEKWARQQGYDVYHPMTTTTASFEDGLTLEVGHSVRIEVDHGESTRLVWESNDPQVARVYGGRVLALKEGACTITVTGDRNEAVHYAVTIIPEDHVYPTTAVNFRKCFRQPSNIEQSMLVRDSAYMSKLVYEGGDGWIDSEHVIARELIARGFYPETIRGFNMASGKHTAGAIFAMQYVDGMPLFAIIVRGTVDNPMDEWVSNFTVGEMEIHEGFSKAKMDVYTDFLTYQNELAAKGFDVYGDCKIWITGHSRGAAVGNLLASTNFKGKQDATYVYLFATPNVSKNNSLFPNVFNYVAENDLVPRIPMWGFDKVGITKKLAGDQFGSMTKEEADSYIMVMGTYISSQSEFAEKFEEKIIADILEDGSVPWVELLVTIVKLHATETAIHFDYELAGEYEYVIRNVDIEGVLSAHAMDNYYAWIMENY